jgi:ABC-type Fe3+-hydroxamate transport system substrate-binding protein
MGDITRQSVQMSTEMVLSRAPEVVIELRYGNAPTADRLDAERRVWDALSSVPAVKQRRVYLLAGDEFVIPGPRVVDAARKLAGVIHP